MLLGENWPKMCRKIGVEKLQSKEKEWKKPFCHSVFSAIFFSFSPKQLGENKNVNGAKTEWQKSITIHFCGKSKFSDSFSIIAVFVFFSAKNSPKMLG